MVMKTWYRRKTLIKIATKTISGFAEYLRDRDYMDNGGVRNEEIFAAVNAEVAVDRYFQQGLFVTYCSKPQIMDFVEYILHDRFHVLGDCGYFEPRLIAYRKRMRQRGETI